MTPIMIQRIYCAAAGAVLAAAGNGISAVHDVFTLFCQKPPVGEPAGNNAR